MKHIDNVDTEGGPLLIADAIIAQKWRGADDDSADYKRACNVTANSPGGILDISRQKAIVWDAGGAGTVDVFTDGKRILVVRAWLDDQSNLNEIFSLARLPLNNSVNIGAVDISSNVLAVLWAAENGESIEALDIEEFARPTGEMASESSGLLLNISNGRYLFLHDEVQIKNDSALRCHIVPEDEMAL